MKRISTIIMALVVVMTMAQCKKNNPTTPDNHNNVVTITLDVKNNNGSRVDVNTTTGTVDFETGDKVYVGSGGKYVGFLTHNGTNFSGNITNPMENQPLQFYFLGNVTPQETLSAGTTEECSVIISDQTEHLPVISCAASNENYVSGVTAYSAQLLNKCALVKFDVTTSSGTATCVTNFNNKVTVDFTDASFVYSKTNDGNIILPAGNGEKWAILLPQEAMEAGEAGSAYSVDGAYTGTCGVVSAIYDNDYLTFGIEVNVTTTNIAPEHEYVDLGLPSGIKWSTVIYSDENATWQGIYFPAFFEVNWGSTWRKPTSEEFYELIQNCTSIWTEQEGVQGRLFTGPNGNSVFFPSRGHTTYGSSGTQIVDFFEGYYWSDTRYYSNGSYYIYYLHFSSTGCGVGSRINNTSMTIMPVCD